MTKMRYICGRLEERYRYSNKIVYNNFPFQEDVSQNNKYKVRNKAEKILKVRKSYPYESLANLYNPKFMPPDLKKAHLELDKAVDKCYRNTKFKDDNDRMKFLFDLYKKYSY